MYAIRSYYDHQKVVDKINNNKQLLDIINNFIIKTNNYQIKRIENQRNNFV